MQKPSIVKAAFLTGVFLWGGVISCSENKGVDGKEGSQKKTEMETDSVFNDPAAIDEKDLKGLKTMLAQWDVMDSLQFSMKEYKIIWDMLCAEPFNATELASYMEKNQSKYVNPRTDILVALTKISTYFLMKESLDNKTFKNSEKAIQAVRNINENYQAWFDKKILFRCVTRGAPLSNTWIFFEDHTLQIYSSFLGLGDFSTDKWKKSGDKIIIYGGDKRLTFIENDSMLVFESKPQEYGRDLYKIK